MVGLHLAVFEANVGGVGEQAHPESGGEAAGDVPVGVGLAEEDQIRGVDVDPLRQRRGHRSRRETVSGVGVEDPGRPVLAEGGESSIRPGTEVDGGDLTEVAGLGEKLQAQLRRSPAALFDENPYRGHLRSPSSLRGGR